MSLPIRWASGDGGTCGLEGGTMAQRVVDPLLGYQNRMKKILADEAYKKVLREWVTNNMLGVELEITAIPPYSQGFVPIKWRWVSSGLLVCLTYSEDST